MIQQHRIRPNETTTLPRRFIYLDTESRKVQNGDTEIQSWRCGVTAFDGWDERKKLERQTNWQSWDDPDDLWSYVTGQCRRRSRTVLVAHNLAFDLRISRGFSLLPRHGWRLSRLGLSDRGMSCTWLNGDAASLVCVDSTSVFPHALSTIGRMIGVEKFPDPLPDDDEGWLIRCRTDVEIMRHAYREYLSMIERDDMGNWQRTGAGMAWANFRHKHYTHPLVVHDSQRARDAESAAVYAARCEAWRHGKQHGGPFTEYDLPLAYPRVARDVTIPTCLRGHANNVPAWVIHEQRPASRWLIRATIDTESPTLPTRIGETLAWPVGRITGWYWDCELRQAREHGATIECHEGFTYSAAPALKAWGNWLIDAVENPLSPYTSIQRAALKHWGRALVGRFGVKYRTWDAYGAGIGGQVGLMSIVDADTGKESDILLLGPESFIASDEDYGSDAMPSVLGVIMAEARCRLWEIMNVAGLDHVVYLDTDSVITDVTGTENIRREIEVSGLWGLRVKSSSTRITIQGPRQLMVNSTPRYAGVPRAATHLEQLKFAGERWESVTAGLQRGHADEVRVTQATWKLQGADTRRIHLPGGFTAPFTLVGDLTA